MPEGDSGMSGVCCRSGFVVARAAAATAAVAGDSDYWIKGLQKSSVAVGFSTSP